MWENVCQQLTHLSSLKYLDLSNNNLSEISSLTLSNNTSLNYLDLRETQMSLDVIESVYRQIMCLENLEDIYVRGFSINRREYSICNINLPVELFRGELFKNVINRFVYLRRIVIKDTPIGCLSSFLPDPHPVLPELEVLDLCNTELNKDDLQHLSHITQNNKLPKLRYLDLSCSTLTGCLCMFLPDPHQGLPQIGSLNLQRTTLNRDDLQHLLHIAYKLPKLVKLDLSKYTLTGCLSSFLRDPYPGLNKLETLDLSSTAVSKEDLEHLSNITQNKKLPNLKSLDLSHNILTGCLSSFLTDPHPGLPELQNFHLKHTKLTTDDLQYLSHITQSKKLPKLRKLDLSEYTLRGMLSSFLPDPHQRLPELQVLYLSRTSLNKDDLQHLSHLIQTDKLPRLNFLDLADNRLHDMETDVEHLIKACVTDDKRQLTLFLGGNYLPQVFVTWEGRYKGRIHIY